ncbi:hypothetical protein niasHS_006959 [Heterodera schachtii]|uniref:Ubiquitin-like domain-containing protein n=1 Tax=Heterodera schachtii TaxID=97005 RepID=A0ABD2JF32_HETSC
MSTITPNTSLTTLGDITSDQNNIWPSFALSEDGNELERLEAQRKAIEAKIAAELARRQMKMEGNEATPKRKRNFGNGFFDNPLSSKVEELSRKCAQLEKGQSEARRTEEDKLSKVEAENRLLKAELKQRETLDELNEMKTKVAKMEQQENALVEQIQKLEEEQKKCLDKYDELEKELARKYICIGQFAKHLARIDEMEAQINELKECKKEHCQYAHNQLRRTQNRHGFKIYVKMLTGKTLTLSDLLPSNTIEEIKIKIERIEGILIDHQRLLFAERRLDDSRTLKDCNIGNGSTIHCILFACGC